MNDIEQCVANEMRFIPSEFRDIEPDLYASKWFDYRRMIPSKATLLFAREYARIYRSQFAKIQDLERAAEITIFGVGQDIFASNSLIHFWRARQEADRIGCRYSYYIRFAFDRAFDRGWRYLPRPNQLYSEDLSTDIELGWFHTQRQILQLADNPVYFAKNYKQTPDQDDYYLYLVQQVKNRSVPEYLLARLVHKAKILPLEFAQKHFSNDLLERALFCHQQ